MTLKQICRWEVKVKSYLDLKYWSWTYFSPSWLNLTRNLLEILQWVKWRSEVKAKAVTLWNSCVCIFSLYYNLRVPASKECGDTELELAQVQNGPYYLLARPFEMTTISMISSCISIYLRLLGYLQMHSIRLTSEFMLHNWNLCVIFITLDFAASRQHPSDHWGPRCLLWFPTVPASSLKLYRNPGFRWPSRLHRASELCPDIHRAAFCVRLEQALHSVISKLLL